MAKRIMAIKLPPTPETQLWVPKFSHIIEATAINNKPVLIIEYDTHKLDNFEENRVLLTLSIIQMGRDIPYIDGHRREYLGTIMLNKGKLIFQVFNHIK